MTHNSLLRFAFGLGILMAAILKCGVRCPHVMFNLFTNLVTDWCSFSFCAEGTGGSAVPSSLRHGELCRQRQQRSQLPKLQQLKHGSNVQRTRSLQQRSPASRGSSRGPTISGSSSSGGGRGTAGAPGSKGSSRRCGQPGSRSGGQQVPQAATKGQQ